MYVATYNTERMKSYAVLIRGINVGGKNMVAMAALKQCLETMGFTDVVTYIASGNVIVRSNKSAAVVKSLIEEALPKNFRLDSELIKVLVLDSTQLQTVIDSKPKGFGDQPDKYHSDAVFLIDISVADAMKVFSPKEGVDTVWSGKGVIYSQRLSELRTKSRLSKIVGTAAYKSMTIRNWNTTLKLLALIKASEDSSKT
jgi:uncharacterized protein (DUF1697 family)